MQFVVVDIRGPSLDLRWATPMYMLVAACYYTGGWKCTYLMSNQVATTEAQKLTDKFFLHFSPPEQLHSRKSDQSRQFESTVSAERCKLLGITKLV